MLKIGSYPMHEPVDLLMILGTRIASHFSDLLVNNFGIGLNQWRILNNASTTGCSIAYICEKTGIHKSIVSREIAAMTKNKLLITKKKLRFVTVFSTPAGLQIIEDLSPLIQTQKKVILSSVTDEEALFLVHLLNTIMSNFINADDDFLQQLVHFK